MNESLQKDIAIPKDKSAMGNFERHVLGDHPFVPILRHPSGSVFRIHYIFRKLKKEDISKFVETSLAERAVLATQKTSDQELQHEYFMLAGVLNFVLLMSEFRYIFVWVVQFDTIRVVDRAEARSTCTSCQEIHSLADGGRACPVCALTQCVVCRQAGKPLHLPALDAPKRKPLGWFEPGTVNPITTELEIESEEQNASRAKVEEAGTTNQPSEPPLKRSRTEISESSDEKTFAEEDFGMHFPEGAKTDVMLRDCPSLTKEFEINLNMLLEYLDNSTSPCTFCGGEAVIKCFDCGVVHFCSLLCRSLSTGFGLTGSTMNSLSRTLRPTSLAVGTTRCACWLVKLGRVGATNQFCPDGTVASDSAASATSAAENEWTIDKKAAVFFEGAIPENAQEFGARAIRYVASRRVRQVDVQRRRSKLVCARCQQAPAILWCRKCQRHGYCSIACRMVDVPHRAKRGFCEGDTEFLGAECGIKWPSLDEVEDPKPKFHQRLCQAVHRRAKEKKEGGESEAKASEVKAEEKKEGSEAKSGESEAKVGEVKASELEATSEQKTYEIKGVGPSSSEIPSFIGCQETASASCDRCNSIVYCSSLCQIVDWPRHKFYCKSYSSS